MEDNKTQIIDYKCPFCDNDKAELYRSNIIEVCTCAFCGERIYCKDLVLKTNDVYKPVRCPYCNSTSVSKISNAKKVGLTAMFGIFAIGKTTKQWHCSSCDSDF